MIVIVEKRCLLAKNGSEKQKKKQMIKGERKKRGEKIVDDDTDSTFDGLKLLNGWRFGDVENAM